MESSRTSIAHIEFTSRCNLRCVFCAASQPGYKGLDIDEETIEGAIEALKKRKIKVLSVNGHGETTIYKNWHLYCNKMLEAGMPLHIISNFSREFSQEELQTLSRFKSIEISCDTSDPGLLKKIRRGADLQTICLNILRLRGMALKERRCSPSISFSCVVSDLNIFNLPEYVAFGKALGINHFNFCNLTKYPDLKDTLNTKHITEMPVELLPEIKATLLKTFEFLESSHIKYYFQQGLLDSLNQKIQGLRMPPANKETKPLVSNLVAEEGKIIPGGLENEKEAVNEEKVLVDQKPGTHRYSSAREGSQTRYCLDPWQFILLQANKDVLPCCWHRPIHSLGKHQSLSESFNNTQIKDLRRRLLTGDLSSYCLNCPVKGWTTVDNLRRQVRKYLNPGLKLLPFKMPGPEPAVFMPFEVLYNEGWYPLEIDPGITDPDWQSWRWMSKKAVCLLKNPKRTALLIIRGGVDKAKLTDQTIFIKLNGTILDEFIPGTAKFFKEYIISPEMMGEDDMFPLNIETDKIFVPSLLGTNRTNDNRELGLQVYHLFFGVGENVNN